jgi:hypothetical protein
MDFWTLETLGLEVAGLFTLAWVMLAIGTATMTLARKHPPG